MSRSKNIYQGISLGKVRRSEYDDGKLKDNARHEARLGVDLKTVDRARNVMKKSLDADRHMLIKTGLPLTRRVPVPSQGTHSHLDSKPPPHQTKPASDSRTKRFSVTEMPSDLDRTRQFRKKSTTRPPSYHEQISNSPIRKELSYSHDKLLESRTNGSHGEEKNPGHQTADAVTAFGAPEMLRRSEPTVSPEIEHLGSDSVNRSITYTAKASRFGKGMAANNVNKSEPTLDQAVASGTFVRDSNQGKYDEQSIENGEDTKDLNCEQSEFKDQETRPRKKATIWETLSTPKYTSKTKSKRSQIEQEFTASRMKSYRSSPALISTANVRSQPVSGQGKIPLKENASSQGRTVEEFKGKREASTRSRNE